VNKITIGFDVYGTLVDPLELSQCLQILIGEKSKIFAELWRQKQLEYTFRRGLMNRYQDFDICTQQAMQYAINYFDISLSSEEKYNLLYIYKTLKPFPDAVPALKTLKKGNNNLVAFSNGISSTLKILLSNAKLLDYLENIISADDLRTFKPNPKVYEYLAKKTGVDLENCWVVSSNSFDVIGAKSAGLCSAWIARDEHTILDPWEVQPDITVNNLIEFAAYLQ